MRRLLVVSVCINVALMVGLLLTSSRELPVAGAEAEPSGNGDVNGDGRIDQSDAVYLLRWLHAGGPAPVPIVCPQCDSCCPPAPPCRLPATGQTTCYDIGDYQKGIPPAEIPCENVDFPGQDGFFQAGCPKEDRFVDNGDGTVTDTCTGLMWQQDTADTNADESIDSEDRRYWADALKYCDNLTFAGHEDWRLPNVRELQSIVDYGRSSDPAIDPVFAAVPGHYWSSSTRADDPSYAWLVTFYVGGLTYGRFAFTYNARLYVRAVRNAE